MSLIVYPNPDSWDEFYPSEIFIRRESSDSNEDLLSVLNKANIGATIIVGLTSGLTETYKKIGDVASLEDMGSNLLLLGKLSAENPGA